MAYVAGKSGTRIGPLPRSLCRSNTIAVPPLSLLSRSSSTTEFQVRRSAEDIVRARSGGIVVPPPSRIGVQSTRDLHDSTIRANDYTVLVQYCSTLSCGTCTRDEGDP
ncbi:hypothetical protein FOMPIDRAFT_1021656 [Fomitopsis schrenkii]|uniref:Uncharacterized protein n=1 Tax=Fomitopsis schrenkii TaxID=2126942 RepID=S8EKY1_FOMSC|nr:hypothetical protein FOMPIDRAFT_1021656 [Fomitopsis schrenkii]